MNTILSVCYTVQALSGFPHLKWVVLTNEKGKRKKEKKRMLTIKPLI